MTEKQYYLNPNIKRTNLEESYTPEQVQEYVRCSQDPVYFIEKYVKINALDEGLIPFSLRGYQQNLVKGYHENRKCIVKSSRQSGKSVTTAAFILWYVFFNADKTVGILANKAPVAREILSRIVTAYETIPYFLQPGAKVLNKGSIELGNNSRIIAAATSSTAIRGFSVNLLYLDEFAYVEDADAFFKSTYPTISSGKETKVIISSTPDGLNLFYKLFTDAQKGLNDFYAFEIAWHEVPGRDENWKKEQIEILGEKGFRQEFDAEFLGSSNTLISGESLRTLASPSPVFDDGETCINYNPVKGNMYVCLVDVSGGVGLDFSTITVIDITESPYRIVYTWRSNKVSAYDLPATIIPIAQKYNDAYLFVERNALGRSVAEDCHYSYEYENIAMTMMLNKRQTLTSGFGSSRTDFGVEMSPLVKKIGCAALKNMIESESLLDLTTEQIYELSNFVSYRKTYAAEKGKHDDFVMNLVLFAWATKQKYFGLIKEEETIKQEKENPNNDFNTPFGIINSDSYEEVEDIKWLFN